MRRARVTGSIPAKLIEDTARELTARAAIDIPADYREGVRLARDREENRLARFVLEQMLGNWEIASADRRPMCADTGLPRYYVKLGNEAVVEGGLVALERALRRATADATQAIPLRPNRVHPLTREDRNDNVGDPRARGHLHGRAGGGLDRRHHRAQGWALRQRLPHAVPGRRHRRHQALLRRHPDRVGQARPRLPARHRGRRHRRGQGHVRAARQGGGVPPHRRQPQPGSRPRPRSRRS